MTMRRRSLLLIPLLLIPAGCRGDSGDEQSRDAARDTTEPLHVVEVDPSVYGNPRQRLTPEQLEQGRLDRGWQRFVQLDSVAPGPPIDFPERWEDISPEVMSEVPMVLPLFGDIAGPSVVRLQVALDRALFSPGVIDGRWGMNTEKAVYWLQRREGLAATGRVDSATWRRLVEVSGVRDFTRKHALSAADVEGPFVTIPEDIYEQAELDCACYESLSEKLAERFHTTPQLLALLNPGVPLDSLRAGQSIVVLDVRRPDAPPLGPVVSLVVSDGGFYLHALDASGRILAHFPATLGADYAPSPQGRFTVTAIAPNPTWHYQPDLLTGVNDWEEEAVIPPGPNNAVGVVWMQLATEHYGIHGTSAPETIGYATSHGCVRLTNWDAYYLSRQLRPGVPVHFRDVS
ncbi:MAG TPA: L,D-transpeptidase family protein [Longimicrobiaceae bacterium]